MKRVCLLISIAFWISSNCYSQKNDDDCTVLSRRAWEAYQSGQIDSVFIILAPCLNNKIKLVRETNRSTRADVYRLMAHAYFFADSTEMALKSVKKMLSLAPNYKPDNQDIERFINAKNALLPLPSITVGINAGTNYTTAQNIRANNILSFPSSTDWDASLQSVGKYTSETRYQVGLQTSVTIGKHLSFVAKTNFSNQAVRYIPNDEIIALNLGTQFTHIFNYLEIPLSGRWSFFPKKHWRPFIQGGTIYNTLITSNKKSRNANIAVTDQLVRHNVGLQFGGGISYINDGYSIEVEGGYQIMTDDINKPEARFLNDRIADIYVYQFYDVIDDMTLNKLSFSISFNYFLKYRVFKR